MNTHFVKIRFDADDEYWAEHCTKDEAESLMQSVVVDGDWILFSIGSTNFALRSNLIRHIEIRENKPNG